MKTEPSKTGKRMITIKDIARLSGCSPTTVSFIINDHPHAKSIPESTKQRVFDVVEELDYVPNAYAKMLREGNPRTIGVISFDMTDPYCTAVLRGIGQYLNEQNFFYQLADVQNDLELLRSFFQAARGRNIEGIIGIVNSLSIEPATLAEFLGKKITFVAIGRLLSGLKISSVVLNNEAGIRLGLRHLYELGHRQIAYIIGPPQTEDSRSRWQGIRQVCHELDLECREEQVVELTDFPATAESGACAVRQLIERKTPFTAVFSYDDLTAYGVIWELSRMGLRVPVDVSVLGFDDIWPSRSFNPPLTTIRQPMEEMGAEGARLIVELMAGDPKTRRNAESHSLVLEPRLMVRQTTAPPPRVNKDREGR